MTTEQEKQTRLALHFLRLGHTREYLIGYGIPAAAIIEAQKRRAG